MSQEPLSISEKIHYTNIWCRELGIKSRDLENHPTIDDAIILLKFHQYGWQFMNKEERGTWGAYWSWVYHKQVPLKSSWLDKLQAISNNVEYRRQQQELRQQTIKQMRERLKKIGE